MNLFAYLSAQTYGNFITQVAIASSVKENFNDSRLVLYFVNDRPYKIPILRYIRNADFIVQSPNNAVLPFECLSQFGPSRLPMPIPGWQENALWKTDLVFSGNMLNEGILVGDNALDHIHLTPEDEYLKEQMNLLKTLGLDTEKWFACVYWKENNYSFRPPNPIRDIDDNQPYTEGIDYIIEKLGGQVVRLGHFNSTKMKPRKGLIDLTLMTNSEEVQLAATYKAKFMVATGSGPASNANVFGIPILITDLPEASDIWGDRSYCLLQSISGGDLDKEYKQTEIYDKGLAPQAYLDDHILWRSGKPMKYYYRKNSADEIIDGIKETYEFSQDPKNQVKITSIKNKRNSISFPLKRNPNLDNLIPFSKRL